MNNQKVITEEAIKYLKKDLLNSIKNAMDNIEYLKKRVQKIKLPATSRSYDDLIYFNRIINEISDKIMEITEDIEINSKRWQK